MLCDICLFDIYNTISMIECDNCDQYICNSCIAKDNFCTDCVPDIEIYNICKKFGYTCITEDMGRYFSIIESPYIFTYHKQRKKWCVLDTDYNTIHVSISFNISLIGLIEIFTKLNPYYCIKIQSFIRQIKAKKIVAYKKKIIEVVEYYKNICNEIKYMPNFGIRFFELNEINSRFYKKRKLNE